ncbi:hypothetical protein [Enterococcus phage vB_EhiS_268]|uniref:Uncharacterized protein n=1 Tax=Enterococcus phage vB_EhiS_268 TaxID=2736817 RepID=A0ACA9ASZ4_9CAUD|nr:hypothetical protein [Enterococcus phage vB_EhiS_268]
MIMYLVIINLLAAIGLAAIIYIIEEIKTEKKKKRKEKFEQDVREVLFKVLDQIKEEEND